VRTPIAPGHAAGRRGLVDAWTTAGREGSRNDRGSAGSGLFVEGLDYSMLIVTVRVARPA